MESKQAVKVFATTFNTYWMLMVHSEDYVAFIFFTV